MACFTRCLVLGPCPNVLHARVNFGLVVGTRTAGSNEFAFTLEGVYACLRNLASDRGHAHVHFCSVYITFLHHSRVAF